MRAAFRKGPESNPSRHANSITMFLLLADGVLDHDLEFLVELLEIVDARIAALDSELARCPDPDAFGTFDRLEAVIGLGFVACQQYIHATYPEFRGKDKYAALQAPPKHRSGRSITEVIHAAVNFWKHHGEWTGITKKSDETRTRVVLDSVFPSTKDYVLSNVLHDLLQPQAPRFASLVPVLTQWRDLLVVASTKSPAESEDQPQ